MAIRRTARIYSGALEGIDGIRVVAEVDISRGLPGFHLVGLPNAEVRESRERVLSALRNSAQKIPLGKITINLAPAGVRKTGASCDLAIAVGVLAAGRAIRLGPAVCTGAVYLGELSLFGEVRPVRGLLAMVMEALSAGQVAVVVPVEQVAEARLVSGIRVVGVRNLAQAVKWWEGKWRPRQSGKTTDVSQLAVTTSLHDGDVVLPDLAGQPLVRKGAVIAAAGGHHTLLVGPPGAGKTRLARSLSALGPPLALAEALEVTRIQSAVGREPLVSLASRRPFRAPHHSTTRAGLVGGGAALRPGEVTLAHEGVLFLDEVAEFSSLAIDGLREPLEDAQVTVVRGTGARTYPAHFQLVAAMNPCRCGYLGSTGRTCLCTPAEINRYRTRLSGPFLDRIELFVEVGVWEGDFLAGQPACIAKPGADWREQARVADLTRARLQLHRWRAQGLASLLAPRAVKCLDAARLPLGLSLRGIERCLSVAATVSALDGASNIDEHHVREALEFRREVVLG